MVSPTQKRVNIQ